MQQPIIPGVTVPAGAGQPQPQQQQQQQQEAPAATDWSTVTKQELLSGSHPDAPPEEVLRIMTEKEAPAVQVTPPAPADGVIPAAPLPAAAAFAFEGSLGQAAFQLDMEKLLPEISKSFESLDFSTAMATATEDPASFNTFMQSAMTQAVTNALAYSQASVFNGLNKELPGMFNSYHGAVGEAELTTNLQSLDIDTPSLKPIVETLGQAYRAANPQASNAEVLAAVQVQLKAVHDVAKPKPQVKTSKQSTDWGNFPNEQ